MTLSSKQKQYLKAKAHALKPVVIIGDNGFSDGVREELNRALFDHQLLKIKLPAMDKSDRKTLAENICDAVQAQLVQSIGRVLVLYRVNPEKPKLQTE